MEKAAVRKAIVSIGEKIKTEDITAISDFVLLKMMSKPTLCSSTLQYEEVSRYLKLLIEGYEEVTDLETEETDYVEKGAMNNISKLRQSDNSDQEEAMIVRRVDQIEKILQQPKYETEELAKFDESLILATVGHLLSQKTLLNPRLKRPINKLLNKENLNAISCLKASDIYQDPLLRKYCDLVTMDEAKTQINQQLKAKSKSYIFTTEFQRLIKPKFQSPLRIILSTITGTPVSDTEFINSLTNSLTNQSFYVEELQSLQLSSKQREIISMISAQYLINCDSDFAPAGFSNKVCAFLKSTATETIVSEVEMVWHHPDSSNFRYQMPEVFTVEEPPKKNQLKRKKETQNQVENNCEEGEITGSELTPSSSSPDIEVIESTVSSQATPSSSAPSRTASECSVVAPQTTLRQPKKFKMSGNQQNQKPTQYNEYYPDEDWYEPVPAYQGPRGYVPPSRGHPSRGHSSRGQSPRGHHPRGHPSRFYHRGPREYPEQPRPQYRGQYRGARR